MSKTIDQKVARTAVEKVKKFCETELKEFFDEYSEDDVMLTASVYASLGTVTELMLHNQYMVRKDESKGSKEESSGYKPSGNLEAGDVEGEKKAVFEIGCRLIDMLAEYTDDLNCVKEILVNLMDALCGSFDIRTETITHLIHNS